MMKKLIAVLLLALPAWAMAFTPVEGKDYKLISNPTPPPSNGVVEVREFFWYGCPHCYTLEPYINSWLKTKPAGVEFERIPAALNDVWGASARGYYVAEVLGLVEKTHTPLFAAIHVDNKRLFTQKSLAKFYAGFGVKEDNFNGLYNSFAVNAKAARSLSLATQYKLTGVPAIVVNGKYMVPGEGSRTIQVINALIAKEKAAQK